MRLCDLYRQTGTPLIIIAGRNYGQGSSRDWAAKGLALMGVRAVLAESFERIHRTKPCWAWEFCRSLFPDGVTRHDLNVTDDTRILHWNCRIRG